MGGGGGGGAGPARPRAAGPAGRGAGRARRGGAGAAAGPPAPPARPSPLARAPAVRPRGRSEGRPGGGRTDPATRATGTRRLVGLSAAAAYADVSTRTLRRYIAHGRLTGYRVGPRLIKIDLNEVDRLARPIPTASSRREPLGYRRDS